MPGSNLYAKTSIPAACWVQRTEGAARCVFLVFPRLHPYGPLPAQVVPALLSLHPPQSHALRLCLPSSLQFLRLWPLFVSYIPLCCAVCAQSKASLLYKPTFFLPSSASKPTVVFASRSIFKELYNHYIIIPPTCPWTYVDIYPSHSRVLPELGLLPTGLRSLSPRTFPCIFGVSTQRSGSHHLQISAGAFRHTPSSATVKTDISYSNPL